MERTYVVIFVFWAMLTIITPTLILWSESAKLELDSNTNDSATEGKKSEGMKSRRMIIGYADLQTRSRAPLVSVDAPAPVPAPAPAPVTEPADTILDDLNTTLRQRHKVESGLELKTITHLESNS